MQFVITSTPEVLASAVSTGSCVYNVLIDADAANAAMSPGTHAGVLLIEGRL